MKISEKVAEIERIAGRLSGFPTIPGTSISRVQADVAVIRRECPEVVIPPGKESMFLWSMGVGAIHMRKVFIMSDTIPRVVAKTYRIVKEMEDSDP